MKKFTLFSLVFLFLLSACAEGQTAVTPFDSSIPTSSTEPVELIVFAAASMQETMSEIAQRYKTVAPNVTITYTFDSSGTLKTQIEEGADCDLFLSAAQKQMDQLDRAADPTVNDKGLDFVLPGTRVDLVENKVVLVVPEENPAAVSSFADLDTDRVELVALGNSDVPVGQYAEEIFINMGVWEGIQEKTTFASHVKEVTTWVREDTVDCGVIYATDAYSAGLRVVANAPEGMLKTPVTYPAAVLASTEHLAQAKAFLDYLQTPECSTIFETVGFTIPNEKIDDKKRTEV